MKDTTTIHIRVDRSDWEEFLKIAKEKGSHGAVEIRKLIKKYIRDEKVEK